MTLENTKIRENNEEIIQKWKVSDSNVTFLTHIPLSELENEAEKLVGLPSNGNVMDNAERALLVEETVLSVKKKWLEGLQKKQNGITKYKNVLTDPQKAHFDTYSVQALSNLAHNKLSVEPGPLQNSVLTVDNDFWRLIEPEMGNITPEAVSEKLFSGDPLSGLAFYTLWQSEAIALLQKAAQERRNARDQAKANNIKAVLGANPQKIPKKTRQAEAATDTQAFFGAMSSGFNDAFRKNIIEKDFDKGQQIYFTSPAGIALAKKDPYYEIEIISDKRARVARVFDSDADQWVDAPPMEKES